LSKSNWVPTDEDMGLLRAAHDEAALRVLGDCEKDASLTIEQVDRGSFRRKSKLAVGCKRIEETEERVEQKRRLLFRSEDAFACSPKPVA